MNKDIDDESIMETTQEQIAEFFAENRPTSQILEEEFKQRAEDQKHMSASVRLKDLLTKAKSRSWYGFKKTDQGTPRASGDVLIDTKQSSLSYLILFSFIHRT